MKGLVIIGALLVLAGIALLIMPPSLDVGIIIGAATIMLVGAVFGMIGIYAGAGQFVDGKIRKEGIPGQAKILDWYSRPSETGGSQVVRFELEVTFSGRSPYKIKRRQLVPINAFHLLKKGATLPVNVHPKNPEKLVLIMWDRVVGESD